MEAGEILQILFFMLPWILSQYIKIIVLSTYEDSKRK